MKSNVSKKKVTIVQSENKKPPILVRNKDQQREISHEQEEMMYLQGQPHIETTTSDKEVNFPPIEEPLKTETRQMKIFKPRENYLKEKINTLNYDRQLLTNIQKDLGSQIDNIKTQIQKETVLITDVPKDLNKYIIRSTSSDNSIIKYSNEDYELKKRHKIIKDLKDEQQNLKKKLMKIEENEALLNNEGFMKLTKSADGITQFDKSIKEQHIKTIKAKKNEINERLKEIEFRIELIIKENNDKMTKREKLQNYKETFERDKEIIEARAKKYFKELEERKKRLDNDINQLVEKRKKEIEEKEKSEKIKKDKIREDFIKDEKKVERERLKKNEEIMLKYKPFINIKNEKTKNDYLYGIYDKKFKDNEEKLIKNISNERKFKSRTVTSAELEEFLTQIEEKKEQIKKKKEIKNRKENEKFEMAKNFKPSYISQFNEKASEDYKNIRQKEENRKEEILALKHLKENYSSDIRKKKLPSVNEELKKKRMDIILELENPKLLQIKDTLLKKKKPIIEMLKNDDPKNQWMKDLYKLESINDIYKNLNNSAIIEEKLIKRPKKIPTSLSAKIREDNNEKERKEKKEKNKKNKKAYDEDDIENQRVVKIDYLKELPEIRKKMEEEMKKKKEQKKKKKLKQKQNQKEAEKGKEAEKEKDNKNSKSEQNINNVSVLQKISKAKLKAENLDRKVEMEEKLLKYNGGIENDPEGGQKLTGYIMGSIKTKLNILNELYKSH